MNSSQDSRDRGLCQRVVTIFDECRASSDELPKVGRSNDLSTIQSSIDAYLAFLKAEDRAPKTLSKYKKVFERLSELAVRRGVDAGFRAADFEGLADGGQSKSSWESELFDEGIRIG